MATALNPLLTLWPSTSSKGSVAPVTSAPWLSMCTEVAVTVGAAPGWVACSCGVPAVVGKAADPAPPPAAESRASWSMFQPVQVVGVLAHGEPCPATVSTMWGPAPSVIPLASGPHGTICTSPPFSPCWVDPTTATLIGWPSIVNRLDTQLPGSVAGVGFAAAPGIPISAMPSGNSRGPAE